MGQLKMTIPYLRSTPSGFYWEPSRKLKALGFSPEALGKDAITAAQRAQTLNARATTEAARRARGEAPDNRIAAGTISWLIVQWRASPEWATLSPATRKSYDAAFKSIEEWCGPDEPRLITRKAIKEWQRALLPRGQAITNVILLRLHRLMERARDEGLIEVNPASRLGLKKVGGDQEPWPRADIDMVCAKALEMGRPSIRLAVLLAANLGQREGDIIKLPRSRYYPATGMFSIQQQKTRTRLSIPATLELRAAIDAAPALSPLFVISETTGRPYKTRNFQAVFQRIRRACGLPDGRHFMHLRHTMASVLGDAGCTDDEIRSITGHLDRTVVARYVRPSDTMTRNAIDKLERHRKL